MGFAFSLFILSGCGHREVISERPEERSPVEAQAFYQQQPEYLQPIYPSGLPAGLSDLSSASCGSCHQEIYKEWSVSSHAYAWIDPQFQAELHKPSPNSGEVSWMCVNCHTPYWDQLSTLVIDVSSGLDFPMTITNPTFDSNLQQEGIGCIGCHLEDGLILGPTGEGNAPHPIKKSEKLLNPEVCNRCHQAEAYFSELNLACVFSTGKEHLDSPYSEQGQSCQHCHMPSVDRPLVPGGEIRSTRRHFFGGSQIPKIIGKEDEVSQMAQYYSHGLSITTQIVSEKGREGVNVEYENANAGHMLPTGDPERFIVIRVRIIDRNSQIVSEEEERIGIIYQWYPEVEKLSDNRLKPKEKRVLSTTLSHLHKGEYTVIVEGEKWRISKESLAYHKLETTVPSSLVFYKKEEKLVIH